MGSIPARGSNGVWRSPIAHSTRSRGRRFKSCHGTIIPIIGAWRVCLYDPPRRSFCRLGDTVLVAQLAEHRCDIAGLCRFESCPVHDLTGNPFGESNEIRRQTNGKQPGRSIPARPGRLRQCTSIRSQRQGAQQAPRPNGMPLRQTAREAVLAGASSAESPSRRPQTDGTDV